MSDEADAPAVLVDPGPMSFDELEAVSDVPSDAEALAQVKASLEAGKDKAPTAEAPKVEVNVTIPKEATAEEKDNTEQRAEDLHKESDAAIVEEYKKIMAMHKDEELSIAAEAMFKHKVDGEDTEVSLQDLLNNFSGKTSWDKKFGELSKERNEFGVEKETIEKYVNTFSDKAQSGDALGAMEYLADISGMDPLKFRRMLRDQMAPKFEERASLDENQRRAIDIEEENIYLKSRQESDLELRQEQQATQDLTNEVTRVTEQHNMSQDDLERVFGDLTNGLETDADITPEMIGEYYVLEQSTNKSEELLGSVDKSLLGNEEAIGSLAKMVRDNPSFTDQDFQDIIKEAFETPAQEEEKAASIAASKKVESTKTNRTINEAVAQFTGSDATFFDDL